MAERGLQKLRTEARKIRDRLKKARKERSDLVEWLDQIHARRAALKDMPEHRDIPEYKELAAEERQLDSRLPVVEAMIARNERALAWRERKLKEIEDSES